MTNTRITDVEILERRYPVILHEFSIREGSGGKGKFNGGDGASPSSSPLAHPPFLELTLSIPRRRHARLRVHRPAAGQHLERGAPPSPSTSSSSLSSRPLPRPQRRVNQPYGLKGGEPGQRGRNLWIKQRREDDGDLKPDAGPRCVLLPLRLDPSALELTLEIDARSTINLGGRNTCRMGAGDRIRIETPGAGGYGREGDADEVVEDEPARKPTLVGLVGSLAERAAAQLGV